MADQRPPAPRRSLPVTWSNGRPDEKGTTTIRSRAPVIQEPTLGDIATFAQGGVHTCGECRFFDPNKKDPKRLSNFMQAAVHDMKWKLGWIAPDPNQLGRCGMSSDTAVGPHSKSCDQFRPRNGKIG